ncbi:hypothetical protein [Nonomuraea sp. NPDC001831]|uniref:hypothetical protein n=1 Tax=Nonomuraea sp. NPDC001831 TaxID=3364340 RepID=UPI0036BED0FF
MNERILPLPAVLRAARTVMCIQVVLVALSLIVFVTGLVEAALVGLLLIPILVNVVIGVAIGVVVARMRSRRPWVRWTGVAVEAVLVATQLWGMISGPSIGGVAGLVLAGGAIYCLLSPPSTAWFTPAAPATAAR